MRRFRCFGFLGLFVPSAVLAQPKALMPELPREPEPSSSFELPPRFVPIYEAPPYEPWRLAEGSGWDWVRLTSGEWLKGTIHELRDGELDFESDELDSFTLDWEDIALLHSHAHLVVVTTSHEIYSGRIELENEELTIVTKVGRRTVKAKDVLSIVEDVGSEIRRYHFTATLGAEVRTGNTNTVSYSTYARLRRLGSFTRTMFEYTGAFGLLDGVRNVNKQRVVSNLDLFLWTTIYAKLAFVEFQYDEFNNLSGRYILGSGAGLHAIDASDLMIDLEVGFGYLSTNYNSVGAGEPLSTEDLVTRPGIIVDWDLSDDVNLELDWTTALALTDSSHSFHHGAARLSIDITSIFDLDLAVTFDRQESPVADAEGNVPKSNDLSMVVGVGVDLE